jgi:WD40 repeat protein
MQTLTGYNKSIVALAISPDGSRLYSAGQKQTLVWVWDLNKLEVEKKLRGHTTAVESLCCSPNGEWLLSAVEYGALACRAGGAWQSLRIRDDRNDEFRPDLAIHPNSRLAAFPRYRARHEPHGVQLWDLEEGNRLKVIEGHTKPVCSVAFSPSGELLASGSEDSQVKLWDLASGKELQSMKHPAIPRVLDFHPDGTALAVAAGGTVVVWKLPSGKRLQAMTGHLGGGITAMAFSPDGKYLATIARDGTILLRDGRTFENLGQRHLEIGALQALVWRPDSSGLIVGGQKRIALCGVEDVLGFQETKTKSRGEPLSLAGHKHTIRGLSWSPDGQVLCSWSVAEVRLWDISQGAGQARLKRELGNWWNCPDQVSWSPDGRRLASLRHYKWQILDVETSEVVREIEVGDNVGMVFTPAGRLFVASRKLLQILGSEGKEVLFSRPFGEGRFYPDLKQARIIGPDDRHVYFPATRNKVYRWAAATGELILLFESSADIGDLSITPDEQLAAAAAGKTVHLHSLPDGKKQFELKHPMLVSGATFVPGGRVLTACNDGVVRLWDASGGRELLSLELAMGKIHTFAVSPDQMIFAAGVQKRTSIVLMDVPE